MTSFPDDLRTTVDRALAEDAPAGDLTAGLVVPLDATCRAELLAQASGVVAGVRAASTVFEVVAGQDGGGALDVEWEVKDGDSVSPGDVLCLITGPARAILRAERVAINFLSHLSGVATLTKAFVQAAHPAEVLCTRKTLPGLRALQREAVLAGGGSLHRASLSEAVLIKENHLRLAGGITEAVRRAQAGGAVVEVEVETLDELDEALAAGADRILLDNPTPELVREATTRSGRPDRIEISGGVTLDSVGALVDAGARLISVGRLTHSAPALDISLEVIDAASL
jgi:nicotinate-nucleotide pyrophosphorylase (carboxylating)